MSVHTCSHTKKYIMLLHPFPKKTQPTKTFYSRLENFLTRLQAPEDREDTFPVSVSPALCLASRKGLRGEQGKRERERD